MPRANLIQTLKRSVIVCYELWHAPLTEPEIDRTLVCSCMVSSIGYDPARRVLQVEFNNGGLYRVDDVPAQTYRALMRAQNFDHDFRQNILNRFDLTKIGSVTPMGW